MSSTQLVALCADGALDRPVALTDEMRQLAADVTRALLRTPADAYFRRLARVFVITDGPVNVRRRPPLVPVSSLEQLKARAVKEGIPLYYESVHVAGVRVRSGRPAVVVFYDYGVARPTPSPPDGPKPTCFGGGTYLAERIGPDLVLTSDEPGEADSCP